ncbi:MAG TPA: glutamate synthase large subunit, partial [Verrucomicrobiae bacterium]
MRPNLTNRDENPTPAKTKISAPVKQGLYDPQFEHDSCGVGFLVHIKGQKSHTIVQDALQILLNLDHRGACGCEANTGDGAGILMQVPHEFFARATGKLGFKLPAFGQYGVGMLFMPLDATEREGVKKTFTKIVSDEGQAVLGWRDIPTDNASLGNGAKNSEPHMMQVFIGRNAALKDETAFERKLYIIRKLAEQQIRYGKKIAGGEMFYVSSLSCRTCVYKGMLMPEQVGKYYPDLNDADMKSALALVHSRFSTNTFPSWDRAHPNRYIAHNGEINTLRGNVNWMHAAQANFKSPLFGDDIKKIIPVINTDGSDSAQFDNCVEMLVMAGRELPHAMMMMIPEPWENHESMDAERRAFYEFHSCLMEPWDGPASMAFTDGKIIGACLDRNGLRPSRYYVTKDDMVIMASEAGVLPVAPDRVLQKGRLQPGRMFLVDTEQGRIVADEELKKKYASAHPYKKWLEENHVLLEDLPEPSERTQPDHRKVIQRQQAFGYTFEDLRFIVGPMGRDGVQPLGSMGTDTPLAVLSQKPQLLYNYFKQLFAQVTNPPIDPIREEIITSTETMVGARGGLLDPGPKSCGLIKLKHPILTNDELEKLRFVGGSRFKSATLPIFFEAKGTPAKNLADALEKVFTAADQAIAHGSNILILSDRDISPEFAPIPALLAVAGLHHHLIRAGTRGRVGIVLESGEPREVHHFALLIGYGCSAINPYLAFATLDDLIAQGLLLETDHKTAVKKYIKAAIKGVVKTMAKMGISTVQSYRGAQIFEAVGLNSDVVDKYFTWTPSRIQGVGLDVIAEEALVRHRHAFPDRPVSTALDAGGQYQWRDGGEYHLFNPQTIHKLQNACRTGSEKIYREYADLINNQAKNLCTLRGLLEFKFAEKPLPIEEVESVESIVKRFKTGAMSYGSISKEAHETLAIAMNRLGGKSNTGEGGEDPDRYVPLPNGDSKNSAIKQVASGRFGVTSHYLVNAQELQIKMAQGAKPGEGGELPGKKVYPPIAKVRGTTAGVGLISPPPHHDIYSIEDLAELIHDLKNSNRNARVSVKLVAEVGVGTVAAGVAKAHADVVLISGHDGGTGASPLSSIKHAGGPWELGLAETHQTLVLNNLRSRIYVETDGQLKTGRDVAVAALLGAEEFGFATAPLVVMGCIMMRVCHLNTCPVGVATQDPRLRKRFTGDPDHVVNFMRFVAQELREIMAKLGFRTLNEMVGRTDKLSPWKAIEHWKARGLDLTPILYQPTVAPDVGRYRQ